MFIKRRIKRNEVKLAAAVHGRNLIRIETAMIDEYEQTCRKQAAELTGRLENGLPHQTETYVKIRPGLIVCMTACEARQHYALEVAKTARKVRKIWLRYDEHCERERVHEQRRKELSEFVKAASLKRARRLSARQLVSSFATM